MLRGFGCKQLNPTEVWKDNAACIQIANNPVNCKLTRHINTRRNAQRRRCADQKPSRTGLDDASSLPDWDTPRIQGVLRMPWHHGDVGCGLGISLGCER
eukprot:106780-Rhodomonas_salina.1